MIHCQSLWYMNVQSVGKLDEDDKINKRCRNLLQYIRTKLISDALIHDLSTLPFLPILTKPASWPMKWNGNTNSVEIVRRGSLELCAPKTLFLKKAMPLIGSVKGIVDTHNIGSSEIRDVLIKLGVADKREVSFQDAFAQMELVVNTASAQMDYEEAKTMSTITHALYKYFEKKTKQDEIKLLNCFHDKPVIWLKGQLVCPQRVTLCYGYNLHCEPEIYWLDQDMKQYTQFLENVGTLQLQRSNILKIISRIQMDKIDEKLNPEEVRLISNLLQLLSNYPDLGETLTEEEKTVILVPDYDDILRRPEDLYIDDGYELLNDQDNVHFINELIPPVVQKMLGIKSKRC